jgi:hypothetical protein
MSFINRKSTRDRILGSQRAKVAGLTRVSDAYLNRLEAQFINMVDRHVDQHPSKGKTFQPYNIL